MNGEGTDIGTAKDVDCAAPAVLVHACFSLFRRSVSRSGGRSGRQCFTLFFGTFSPLCLKVLCCSPVVGAFTVLWCDQKEEKRQPTRPGSRENSAAWFFPSLIKRHTPPMLSCSQHCHNKTSEWSCCSKSYCSKPVTPNQSLCPCGSCDLPCSLFL